MQHVTFCIWFDEMAYYVGNLNRMIFPIVNNMMFSNMFNNALEHINFDAKTFSKKSALSVPVPARSNTPWGPFFVIFDGFWKPRFCIPYSTFRTCVLKIDAFLVWNLNTVQHFLLMQVKKCRKVFIFLVEFEYSTWFFAYGSPKVP